MTPPLLQTPQPRIAKVIHHLTWEQLEELDRSLEDIAGLKLVYLDGTAEIMPVSEEYKEFKVIIRRLLEAYLEEAGIHFYGRGGPTLGNRQLKARNEPDESYNLGSKKPYPDLVIEVTVTSGGVDKLEGYRRMGVPEVWFWEDGMLAIYHLSGGEYQRVNQSMLAIYHLSGGEYQRVNQSELLKHLPLDVFCRYITYHDQYEAVQEFRQTIRRAGE